MKLKRYYSSRKHSWQQVQNSSKLSKKTSYKQWKSAKNVQRSGKSFTYFVVPTGRSDPAPMIAPVPFGMNSSSSQLLDLLQALRLGQFFFFPSLTSRLPIKKIYSTAQAFQTPTTYLPHQKP